LDFNEDDGVAVASGGSYANHLHLTPDRQPRQHLNTQPFKGRMPFLTPGEQCQSTKGSTAGSDQESKARLAKRQTFGDMNNLQIRHLQHHFNACFSPGFWLARSPQFLHPCVSNVNP